MPLTLKQTTSIAALSEFLYPFLPGNPHPYADHDLSFPGAALASGVLQHWQGGSKGPAINALLTRTLEFSPREFCPLLVNIVKRAIPYSRGKATPITRERIDRLNVLIKEVGFKIPELIDLPFLNSLPTESPKPTTTKVDYSGLLSQLINMQKLDAAPRGYEFERFLLKLFKSFSLEPNPGYSLVGEQIDGSFIFKDQTYLLEATWRNSKVGASELREFSSKVKKATWSRGLLISYAGFTEGGIEAYEKDGPTNLICLSGDDMSEMFLKKLDLRLVLEKLIRVAAEKRQVYPQVRNLFP